MTATAEGARRALLVATDEYADASFQELRAPTGDVAALAEVLGDPEIGGFELQQVVNEPKESICEEIEGFFADATTRDLLLLYLSCHGVLSRGRKLYFAAKNTKFTRLHATGISEGFIEEVIDHSRAQRVLLVLDCCHSGAYGQKSGGKGGGAPDLAHRFDGQGRATLTASTRLEYAFEEESEHPTAEGEVGSVFTRVLVEGLRTGKADHDGDGHVSLDELYDYVYAGVRERTPHQTPELTGRVRGDIWVAKSAHAVALPEPIRDRIDSDEREQRLIAVQDLLLLAHGAETPALAQAALHALGRLVEDDSRTVAAAAGAALAGIPVEKRSVPAPPPAPEPETSKTAPPPTESLRRGDDALGDGRARPALKHYERALAEDPSSVDALTGRAWALFRLHRFEEAQADFDDVLKEHPDHLAALVGRSRALSERYRTEEALRDADRAVELDPESAAAHVARGEALYSSWRYEEMLSSIAAYDAALRIDPNCIEALVGRAHSFSFTGDDPAALADVDRALALNDRDPQALLGRAGVLATDDAEAAQEDLERALELDPNNPGAHLGFSMLRLDQGRHDEARTAAERALELNPDALWAALVRGLIHMTADEYDAAGEVFQRLHRAVPRSGLPLVFLGGVHVELEDYKTALRDFSRADRADSGLSRLLEEMDMVGPANVWRGRALAALDRHQEALVQFDAAIAAEPRFATALYHRAETHVVLGSWEAAVADITRAAEIEPESEEFRNARQLVIRAASVVAPEKLSAPIRRELEERRARNVEILGSAKFENDLYNAQKQLLQEQLTGTEELLWLCRVAKDSEFFRSVALLLTSEKLLACRESAMSNAHAQWVMWTAVEEVEDVGANGFRVKAEGGTTLTFSQVQNGTDLSGEGLDLSGASLRDAVRHLAGISAT